MNPDLSHIENWVFDLDNTLYPASSGLYQYMDERIRTFVARSLNLPDDEAHRVQKQYFRDHGTTLSGMMAEHGTDPYEYLEFAHQFPLEILDAAPRLAHLINALPGRKLIFTNADAPYARRVLEKLELSDCFESIVDIHACAYNPKPHGDAYAALMRETGIDPATSFFAEDMKRNLAPAKQHGMTTLWLNHGTKAAMLPDEDEDQGYIDFTTDNLADWLHNAIETLRR